MTKPELTQEQRDEMEAYWRGSISGQLPSKFCLECGEPITLEESRRLNLDIDCVPHGDRGHLIRR